MSSVQKFLLLPLLLFVFPATAQDASDCFYERNAHEFGVLGGASYYMGDFNANLTPLKQPSWYAGVMYRYNLKRYFAFRAQLGYGNIKGSGEGVKGLPEDPMNNNWKFDRPWIFGDAMVEFNFMPYNAVDIRKNQRFTPLLMLGLGVSNFGSNAIQPESYSSAKRGSSPLLIDIPVGIGFKWCVAERFTLGAEWLWRISFYDEIDYYAGVNADHSATINNDWIGSIGLTLSYHIPQYVTCPANNPYKPSKRKYDGRLNK